MKTELQFQASKRKAYKHGFPGAVQQTLELFQSQVPGNIRRGQATLQATVTVPEDGAYFVIVFAGPFANLESLQAALRELGKEGVAAELRRIGID